MAVLRDNDQRPGLRGWLEMVRLVVSPGPLPPPAVLRGWMRKCCRCPIHDRKMKRCGANDGLGCGCHAALSIAAGKSCWLREREPDSPYGY